MHNLVTDDRCVLGIIQNLSWGGGGVGGEIKFFRKIWTPSRVKQFLRPPSSLVGIFQDPLPPFILLLNNITVTDIKLNIMLMLLLSVHVYKQVVPVTTCLPHSLPHQKF